MANKNSSGNVYIAKPNENLRTVLENAIVQARALKSKKILVIVNGKTFELNADNTIGEAMNIWFKTPVIATEEKSQKTR